MVLPVAPDLMKVTFHATLLKGAVPSEEAQFGFTGQLRHFIGNQTDWPAIVQTAADGIRDKWNEHIQAKNFWPSSVRLDHVKVDHLDQANGKVLDQGVATFDGDDAWAGTGNASLPWETSLCVSLYAYVPGTFAADKGRKRGRMYLPPFSPVVLGTLDGQMSDGLLQQLVPQLGDFFNDVQGMHIGDGSGQAQDYFNLVIASKGTTLKPLPPTTHDVIRIQADTKIDSQRRREKQQDANNVSFEVVAHS